MSITNLATLPPVFLLSNQQNVVSQASSVPAYTGPARCCWMQTLSSDMTNTQKISTVIVSGLVLDHMALDSLLADAENTARKR